jgi:hypothetical protein
MVLRLLAFAFLRVALSTTTFDDMDKSFTVYSSHMQETGLEHCQAEAHAGNFHHDGGTNKGKASFTFKFDVSQDGCYSLEEYHPGSDPKCSQLLASNAQLDIDWCVGKKSTLTFDQTTNGGAWNFLAIFPYFVGHPGLIKVSNPAGLEGQHLIVDAFRITRVADKCTADLQHQLWRESQKRKPQTLPKTSNAASVLVSKFSWQEGSLQLSLQANDANDKNDLLASLNSQTATLEATLTAHLQARSVLVTAILPMDARRLAGCRRLQALGESFTFDIRFKAEVPTAVSVTEPALSSALATALAGVGAKFQVESVEFHWQSSDADEKTTSDTGLLSVHMILAVVLLAVVLLVVFWLAAPGAWRACRSKKRVAANAVASKETQKKLEEGQGAKTYDHTDPPKKILEQFDDNASTATPDSDPAGKDLENISVALETE